MDNRAIYEWARLRITELVAHADSETPVPTCPGWSVKDVVAHLAGSLDDYKTVALEGASLPSWGEGHVEQRRNLPLEECIAEWERHAKQVGDLFESRLAPVIVADILAHEQDIRAALGAPPHLDPEGISTSLSLALGFIDQKLRASKLPAVSIVTEDMTKVIGEGEPVGTLRTSTFELWRALHGRRSVAQVRAFDWDVDPEPWMDVLFLFGPAEADIHE